MDLRSIVKPARSVLTVLKVSSAKRLREELSPQPSALRLFC